jgi:AcrR family transcriptional regulator
MNGKREATGPGRHPLPQEFLDRHKRERVLAAITELAHERGAGELTTTQIVAWAKISRTTLYEIFDGKAGYLEFACEEARRHLVDPIEAAGEAPGPWVERIDGAVGGFLKAAAERPLLAELGLIHSAGMRSGSELPCHQAVVEALARVAEGGREAGRQLAGSGAYREPQPKVGELVACAIVSVVALRVRDGSAELPGLREELVGVATRPFLGAGAAGRYGRRLAAA